MSRFKKSFFEQYIKNKINEKSKSIGDLMFAAAFFSFSEDKISDDEINKYLSSFDKPKTNNDIYEETKTPIKPNLNKPIIFNTSKTVMRLGKAQQIVNKIEEYDAKNDQILDNITLDNFVDLTWEKMIDSNSIKMWRRPLDSNPKLFEYKVCGTFDDITPNGFTLVQSDIEYRKKWDNLVVELKVIDKDEDNQNEVIKWVTKYPSPMRDREYIYCRRLYVNTKEGLALIVSKSMKNLDSYKPKSQSNFGKSLRINDYKSVMFIKAHNSFNEKGMDYYLIYYDDPKTSFPKVAVNWISSSGIPSFIEKLHQATLDLEKSTDKLKLLNSTPTSSSSPSESSNTIDDKSNAMYSVLMLAASKSADKSIKHPYNQHLHH